MSIIVSVFCTLGILASFGLFYLTFRMYNMLMQVAEIVNTNVDVLNQLREQQEKALDEEEPEPIGLIKEE